jgi:DeoR/GlpR family transcriptional regulator of sugar metabolism
VLADSSKYDQVQFERVCALADIDDLVSEASPPKRLAASLKSAGVRMMVAAD